MGLPIRIIKCRTRFSVWEIWILQRPNNPLGNRNLLVNFQAKSVAFDYTNNCFIDRLFLRFRELFGYACGLMSMRINPLTCSLKAWDGCSPCDVCYLSNAWALSATNSEHQLPISNCLSGGIGSIFVIVAVWPVSHSRTHAIEAYSIFSKVWDRRERLWRNMAAVSRIFRK